MSEQHNYGSDDNSNEDTNEGPNNQHAPNPPDELLTINQPLRASSNENNNGNSRNSNSNIPTPFIHSSNRQIFKNISDKLDQLNNGIHQLNISVRNLQHINENILTSNNNVHNIQLFIIGLVS